MDEITLDIVDQPWAGAMHGLKPYIIIDDATGEIIEHFDVIYDFLADLKKHGGVLLERPEPVADIPPGERVTRITKVVPMPK